MCLQNSSNMQVASKSFTHKFWFRGSSRCKGNRQASFLVLTPYTMEIRLTGASVSFKLPYVESESYIIVWMTFDVHSMTSVFLPIINTEETSSSYCHADVSTKYDWHIGSLRKWKCTVMLRNFRISTGYKWDFTKLDDRIVSSIFFL